MFLTLLVIVLFALWIITNRRVTSLERDLARLRKRLEEGAPLPAPGPSAAPLPPPAPPTAPPGGLEAPATPPTTGIAPTQAPAMETPPGPPPPAAAEAAPTAPAGRRLEIEQLVGGVWLQNVGSVLLLVGFFFLILWGFATGRLGPEILVLAGVLAGAGLVWRGAVLRRTVRGIGHALVGVGAGVMWLAIYIGHFSLHVLSTPVAYVLVAATSVFTGLLGLRYGVQSIAALGVIGAHLPNVLRELVPGYGFTLPTGTLLAYLAGLNALVFFLAARAGWSALALASVLLTAVTWIAGVHATGWSWPVQIGLTALFAGLGVAPVAWLVRRAEKARPIDLAVMVVSPLAFLAASTPMFQHAQRMHVALLLLSLAVIYLFVALWVDGRRTERDLWRPLTAAAILFLSAAIERAVSLDRTAMVWTLEGVALMLVGLRPRGEWLRWCGHVVAGLGTLLLLGTLPTTPGEPLPLVNERAVTMGLAIVGLLFGTSQLARNHERLGALERVGVHAWFVWTHLLLFMWLAREAHHLAWALERGAWRSLPDVRAASGEARYWGLLLRAMPLAWTLQAAWLVRAGVRGRRIVARVLAYAIALVVTFHLVFATALSDAWRRNLPPLVHRDALVALTAVALFVVVAAYLSRNRASLMTLERRAAEAWATAGALMLMVWIALEGGHLARVIMDVPGSFEAGQVERGTRLRVLALGGMLTSVGWLAEAVAAFVVGWVRRSAYLRWMGLALVGITVLKFLVADLANADPFWRFVTAIIVGAAMLALSYVYQRFGLRKANGPAG